MEDRISTYPGRVKLTPVEGQENTYDMERMDSPIQQGTPINKISLLKDATAALYGLGADAVPDDVLAFVGKYNEHWWSLLHGQAEIGYKADIFTNISSEYLLFSATNVSGVTDTTISYSKSVTVSSDNVISLVNPESFTVTKSTNTDAFLKSICSTLASNAPCYVKTTVSNNKSYVFYLPSGSTGATASNGNGTVTYRYVSGEYYIKLSDRPGTGSPYAQIVTTSAYDIPAGETTYEHSTDRNAYPDSGTVDGITYTYLGVPFDDLRLISVPKTDVMSYVGVGAAGSSNPTKLIFNKKPRAFMVYGSNVYITWISDRKFALSIYQMNNYVYIPTLTVTWNGSTANVYSEDSMYGAVIQANQKNATYHVIAFY